MIRSNLRVKRSDPWHWANASPKAVAVPAQTGQDANPKSHTCLDLVRKPASASASPSELRGLTQQFSDRKALDGPAMRPEIPLAVENGVGKLAAPRGCA